MIEGSYREGCCSLTRADSPPWDQDAFQMHLSSRTLEEEPQAA